MSSKRKREDDDDFGSDEDGMGQSRGRSGRMRKKSAKVIEMEEAEELEKMERKQWKKDQQKATKKSKTIKSTLLRSPGEETPVSVKQTGSMLVMDLGDTENEPSSPQEPHKMKINVPSLEKSVKKKGKKLSTEPTSPESIQFLMPGDEEHNFEDASSIKQETMKKKKADSSKAKKGKSAAAVSIPSPPPPGLSPELLAHLSAGQDHTPQVLDMPKKEKVKPPVVKTEEAEMNSDDDDDDEDLDDDIDDEEEEPVVYTNTAQMAQKVLTSSEKKSGKGKKKKEKGDPDKPKKKRGPTAYMLWCNSRRPKLVEDNPGIDFATISKKLGEIWQSVSEKEKMTWKKKAKKLATKGSSMINTGKVKQASTLLNKGGNQQSAASGTAAGRQLAAAAAVGGRAAVAAATSNRQQAQDDMSIMSVRSAEVTPLDAAAHLKLLGESLSLIGARLQEHQGKIAVQGSFSVLLDSLLCALGPLVALTNQVQELDGAPASVHNSTLDNIAYVMPGIG